MVVHLVDSHIALHRTINLSVDNIFKKRGCLDNQIRVREDRVVGAVDPLDVFFCMTFLILRMLSR